LPNRSSMNSNLFELPDDYRPRQHAKVWQAAALDWREQLSEAVMRGKGTHAPTIFFRADDIGAGGRAFEALCRLFRRHEIPLGMAVVPAWLSDVRKSQLFGSAPLDEPLWGWHQHGWRHVNWQRAGKKSEFGEQRPFEKQWRDIWQGQQKMQEIFGGHLVRVFTPPWNRLSSSTLKILQELGFRGVSMAGPFPRGVKPPVGLANLRVQLDLHTRRSTDGDADFQDLLDELKVLLGKKDPWGIMIHHQRMTAFAFQFLDQLLSILKHHARADFLRFKDVLEQEDET
jgi:peptidoglycan/xylan/chitin deacetylase (PgdA/CDA1 family)